MRSRTRRPALLATNHAEEHGAKTTRTSISTGPGRSGGEFRTVHLAVLHHEIGQA